jgi:predicted AAA+ superfamily ATPase
MEPNAVFEEWSEYAGRANHRQRETVLPIDLAERKVICLTGVRRSGKSSLLMYAFQRTEGKKAFLNLEDSRLSGKTDVLDEALGWFGDEGVLFLDEVSAVDGWEGWLARMHELAKGKLRIICSSSRAAFLKPAKPLRGRLAAIELFPLSFAEFLGFRNIELERTTAGKGKMERALEEYLRYGGFPEPVLINDETEKVSTLQEYFNDIVALDVAEASGESVELVELFGACLLKSAYFSATKFVNTLKSAGYGVGKSSLLSLEKYMEDAYLFFFVPIFSFNIADRLQYARKVYAVDTGFLYAVSGIEDKGRFYENAVFLKLRREKSRNPPVEINYWKSKEGHEVDFVLRKGLDAIKLVQVVYELDDKSKKREIRALIKAGGEFGLGKKENELIVVTKDYDAIEKIEGYHVRFVRLGKWLLER